MGEPVIQTSFHAGEWAPALGARVDLAKYHSAAALLKNFFVDYRGGASSRPGTEYIIQSINSAKPVRLIPFQAAATVGYILEFGDFTIRFIFGGAMVLETGFSITGITQANPGVVTAAGNNFSDGDVVFISGVVGMTQVNGRYYKVLNTVLGTSFMLHDLNNGNVSTIPYTAYSSGGTVSRVYTLQSPYAAEDLALLKFTQNVDQLEICHPSYAPRVLTLISANNWTIQPVSFGATIPAPTNINVATTLGAGTVNYSYTVTAVDANGQESAAGTAAALASKLDLRTTAGSNRITWTGVTGAVRYNVYKAELVYANAVPAGAAYGFIGDTTGTTFDDTNIDPDFLEVPPIPKNPFQGAGVESATITAAGTYTTVPSVTIAAAPAGGQTATAIAVLQITVVAKNADITNNWSVGDICYFYDNSGVSFGSAVVATVAGGLITAFQALTYPGSNRGGVSSGTVLSNPRTAGNTPLSSNASKLVSINLTWGVGYLTIINHGSGYTSAPAITFSAGAATATAVLETASAGNPTVPAFINQRLALMGPPGSPQQFNLSKPGLYTNFDISNPTQPDDAIQGTLVSGQLNEIKSAIPMPSGLIILTNKNAWQLYGGGAGQPVSATEITAQPQAYNGANDVPPIVVNFDILYVQSKGSSVRDLSYNFYTNIYTGTDISVLSSHLFFGRSITEWAYAEEPFKLVWAIRDDGVLLSLTFLKEQDLIGWTQHNTDGEFKSTASVTEIVRDRNNDPITVDATYFVVERTINGNTVKYVERLAERFFNEHINPMVAAWCVDAGLKYEGVPTANFSGGEHLAGETIVGTADGIPITPFVMPASGSFSISGAVSVLIVGLQFTPQLQTLPLDLGNPTVQGEDKKITGVTVKVERTLGLTIGQTFDASSQVRMKDLVIGQVGTMTNEVVSGLVTGDARTVIDPDWTVPGQYCIEQPQPLPATILGVVPEISVGRSK